MLSRLDPADSVPAGQRVVRSARVGVVTVVPPSPAREPRGQGRRPRALPFPGAERRQASEAGAAGTRESPQPEWRDANAWAPEAETQAVLPFRTQHIVEAYLATEPVQPRPGLYLRVQA